MSKSMESAEARWLLDWFERRGPVPGQSLAEKLKVNYFEAGLIDSLGVIDLVMDIEKEFPIKLNEKSFQDRRFSTLGGLAEIIKELSHYAKK